LLVDSFGADLFLFEALLLLSTFVLAEPTDGSLAFFCFFSTLLLLLEADEEDLFEDVSLFFLLSFFSFFSTR